MTHILVVSSDHMLIEGVTRLLVQHLNFQVSRASKNGEEALLEEISKLKPDVLICDDRIGNNNLTALVRLLLINSDMRLIVLSFTNNRIRIYEKQEMLISDCADLATAICKKPPIPY